MCNTQTGVVEYWPKKKITTPTLHVPLRSRRQPLDQPTPVRLLCVTKSVVQTVGAALPEFNPIRFESITTPVRRQWNRLVPEAFGHFCHARVQNAPTVEHLALTRRPGAQLAPS